MEIPTPPISPVRNFEDDCNVLETQGGWGFHCVGETSKKISFDPQGFLLNGYGDLKEMLEDDCHINQTFFSVFQQLYDIDSPFPDDLERLFRVAKNRICILESALKMNVAGYGMFSNNVSEPLADLEKIRQELRGFFVMLRILITLQYKNDDSLWAIEQTLPTILKGLKIIRAQLGWFTDLPSHILTLSLIKSKTSANGAFHLFHCHLEIRWLYISILVTISMHVNTQSRLEGSQVAERLTSIHSILQSAIKLCVVDLLEMAVAKFNKTNLEVLAQTSAFNCMCVKELWLLLKLNLESTNSNNSKAFWELIDSLLGLVTDCDASRTLRSGWRPLDIPAQVSCTNPSLFSLWFLQNIGDLYTCMGGGAPLVKTGTEVEGSHLTLKSILSNATGSPVMDEAERRVLITLVKGLMKELWKSRPEPIMILWEGFCRNLDSAFLLQGAPLSAYVLPSETIEDIINSVKFDETAVCQQKVMNSFSMFLYLLGNFLKHDPSQWKSKMRGRFCSKLSEKKVKGLTDRGLFHLMQLFLTIAMHTEESDEVVVLFENLVCFHETKAERNVLIMKAKLSFIYLLIDKRKPVAPHLNHLTQIMNSFSHENLISVGQVFINNLRIMINCTNAISSDLHLICGDWLASFLKLQSRQESSRNLLRLVAEIMKKVLAESNNIVGAGKEKLVTALRIHVLPFVKEHKRTTVWEETADVAVFFTLAALEFAPANASQDSYESLLHHFLISDSSNIVFIKRYLQQILGSNQIHHITEGNESQQVAFIQAWMRCCTLSANSDCDNEVNVTKKIFMMPYLRKLVSSSNNSEFIHSLEHTSLDPLVNLIESVGKEPTVDKEGFNNLIKPMTVLIQKVKSSLFPKKSKNTSWKTDKTLELPKDAIIRAFYVFGKLVSEVSTTIYKKNSSSFLIILIDTLIIPPDVMDMDSRLPPSMDEGLRKSLHFYLQGLVKLEPDRDTCIKRRISKVVEVYVPRFGVYVQTDPFRQIWDDPANLTCGIYIVKIVCDTLLNWHTNSAHKHLVQGLQLVNDLVRRNSGDDFLLGVVIEKVFPKCLLIAAKGTDVGFASKRQEIVGTLQIMFQSEAYQSNASLGSLAIKVLSELSEEHLSFCTEIFFRMLMFLTKNLKAVSQQFLPVLEENIKKVIAKRGSGSDKTLQSFLTSFKSACNS